MTRIKLMKQVFPKSLLVLIFPLLILPSCVSIKKFKALEENNIKVGNTLLVTKQELSKTKLQLNKFKDSSSSNSAEQDNTINSLKTKLQENKTALNIAKTTALSYKEQLNNLKKQSKENEKLVTEELAPFHDVQKNLTTQNNSLKSIKQDLENLLVENSQIKTIILLNKDELSLSFNHNYLFLPNQSLSPQGRAAMNSLAKTLKKYPTIYIDINGHVATGGDKKNSWRNSTRKALSVISALTYKKILPNRMRAISYGENKPIASNEPQEGEIQNNRTEIVLHYQNMNLLKLIPLKNED
jgi:outer membrane protein OmpA-like peptidoglycan-associated protein